jgi:hypothetical protein
MGLKIRFVQNYDSFLFGYIAPKAVHTCMEAINDGIRKKTLDLKSFVLIQTRMLEEIYKEAYNGKNRGGLIKNFCRKYKKCDK